MEKEKRVESILDFVKLPITIDSDDDYKKVLQEKLELYINWISVFINDSNYYISRATDDDKIKLINRIKYDCIAIKKCVNDYYVGKVGSASQRIRSLLEKIIKEDTNKFVVAPIDSSYSTRLSSCFAGIENENIYQLLKKQREEQLCFYRARTDFFDNPKEMYHIPLNKRDLVGTERFSIPGVPCLYLGTSAFDVWLELDRPPYCKFNVSAIRLNEEGKKLSILNLACNPYILFGISSIGNDDSGKNIGKINNLTRIILRLYPLVIATSIRNKGSAGKFRSEYIVSQLLMMNLQSLGCDGISYISKRIGENEEYAFPQMVNIALPVYKASEIAREYGEICEKIEITKPLNYEEFMSLELDALERNVKNSYYAKVFNVSMMQNPSTNIVSCGRTVNYGKTKFFRFENSLCGQKFYRMNEVMGEK
ncbi:hypothetical protein SAMN02745229_03782 [Butyrivibrio fibrisolvens DSM 3071]|uniref:RES domain-containing protein n=1 Tax=Butyrivibrio fibrisolvens DSM 3071 TaxID=1121131 RepID=A0A1M6EST9_BUTFI|nr:hypothetical protein [Butyrivibrio fibrisolvens]SHI88527.1 hypothetical protein SAMN02745229_03782 [Butyrivibrio fibrisolvens DSM 3071]